MAQHPSQTLFFFSRLMGLSLAFYQIQIHVTAIPSEAILTTFLEMMTLFLLYCLSCLVIESITLYGLGHKEEILRKKNMAYSMYSFSHSISIGMIVAVIFKYSNYSFFNLIFLWPYSLVLYGPINKIFSLLIHPQFKKLIAEKNIPISFSAMGHNLGTTFILIGAFYTIPENQNIEFYLLHVLMNLVLGALIYPIFVFLLGKILKIDEKEHSIYFTPQEENSEDNISLGKGLFEGIYYLSCGLMSSIVTSKINFDALYNFQ